MPELYEHLNPMPFEAAAQMEKDLTEDLRAEGYTVTGGNVTNHCTCDMPAQQKASSEREPDREQEIRASSMLIPDIIYGRYDQSAACWTRDIGRDNLMS